ERLEDRATAAAGDAPDERVRWEREVVVGQLEAQLDGRGPGAWPCAGSGCGRQTSTGERLVEREPDALVEVLDARQPDDQGGAAPGARAGVGRGAPHADRC